MSRRCIALTRLFSTTTLGLSRVSCCTRDSIPNRPSPTVIELDLTGLFIFVPVLLFSVIAHEYAHGYAALRQGDQTALMLGRLTWNPIKHIDPMMTIVVPAMLWIGSGGKMLLG